MPAMIAIAMNGIITLKTWSGFVHHLLIPSLALIVLGIDPTVFPFGGTSVLIAVGVALETMKQLEAQLMMRNYEGFLK